MWKQVESVVQLFPDYFNTRICTSKYVQNVCTALLPPLVSAGCQADIYLSCATKAMLERQHPRFPCLFTLDKAVKLCERSLIRVSESVKFFFTSVQWQQYLGELLRIYWTFLLVSTAGFAIISCCLPLLMKLSMKLSKLSKQTLIQCDRIIKLFIRGKE